jgi:hypothetical protein
MLRRMSSATPAISIALASALFVLAMLHVGWAVRAKLGDSVVIPKVDGRPVFTPSRTSTLLVASALLGAMFVALLQGRILHAVLPDAPVQWAALAAGSAFLLRAVGEFRLVGFFKRVRNSDFARWDDWCFSPLSALIGSAFLYLALH